MKRETLIVLIISATCLLCEFSQPGMAGVAIAILFLHGLSHFANPEGEGKEAGHE